MLLAVIHTHAAGKQASTFSFAERSFASRSGLITCSGIGAVPLSSSKTLGKPAADLASYLIGFMNARC